MPKNNILYIFFVGICSLLVFSCTPKEDEELEPEKASDREVMLTNLTDEIIIPSYGNFKLKLDDLVSKSIAFTDNPNTTSLVSFRAAWVDCYKEWQKVELFEFGPAGSAALRSYYNLYPANTVQIEKNVIGTYDLTRTANYSAQGFPGLDYLINGLGSTDADIILKYTTDANASKRIAYLSAVVSRMNTLFTGVNTAWTVGGYRETFISNTSLDGNSSTSHFVNAYVLNFERYIRSSKIGIPAGAMTPGYTYPERVEAYYKRDISLDLAKIAFQASVECFNGKSVKTGIDVPSLKTYLNSIDARDSKTNDLLTIVINNQSDTISKKLALLNNDLSNEVVVNNAKMIAAFDALQAEVRLLKLDMTSAMSITISYTDNDGD